MRKRKRSPRTESPLAHHIRRRPGIRGKAGVAMHPGNPGRLPVEKMIHRVRCGLWHSGPNLSDEVKGHQRAEVKESGYRRLTLTNQFLESRDDDWPLLPLHQKTIVPTRLLFAHGRSFVESAIDWFPLQEPQRE